jgi:hypothetical protein
MKGESMDALIQAKVCKVLREPLLNPKVRTGLIFTAITIKTKEERKKFNTILDSFMGQIKETNLKKKGAAQPGFKDSLEKFQVYC